MKQIRCEADRKAIARKGFKWVTVTKGGTIMSAHKNYEAANRNAKGRDRTIVEIAEGHSL